ncbi:protein phosphatase 2C domain-containing protein [Glycomyces buryatensis]|uniref:Protein phosphatase 2C domain-containing protein n=1 Tax=Glycomyces buryatensis TaxID=2570927 RepID=A0A4S8QGK2_9ACTN|nr:protein phosphatase 2C domain-containing protein [Glycomyces buryatensis]THV42095.1 protein phosphatase 2C domain-containing protein [Glycomyces buryatensis]
MLTPASAATQAGGSVPNEDYYLVAESWALVLDGVTRYPDDGCVHDVPWYVAALGAALAGRFTTGDQDLRSVLAEAIAVVATLHGDSCDLSNPVSPAATVAIVRARGGRFQWLVLGDCAIAWREPGSPPQVESDDRLARLTDPPAVVDVGGLRRYSVEYIDRVRNRPNGFWVASADPHAAREARTGDAPLADIDTACLFTDGLTRLAERYGRTWEQILDLAETEGIPALIEAVRREERDDPRLLRKAKRHDDATGVLLRPGAVTDPA